jgi:hypothetical protein
VVISLLLKRSARAFPRRSRDARAAKKARNASEDVFEVCVSGGVFLA